MIEENKMLGYCPLCMQNVEHTRKFSSFHSKLLNVLTLGLSKVFRIGPYYCFQCENKTLYLRTVRRDAPTFDHITSEVNFFDPYRNRRKQAESEPGSVPEISAFEPVGNLLKTEHSLLMQDRRSQNFSQKFRDGAVLKVLAGNATMQDTRKELNITDTDFVKWMADLMRRKEQQIEELEMALETVQKDLPVKIAPSSRSSSQSSSYGGGDIVEGKLADN